LKIVPANLTALKFYTPQPRQSARYYKRINRNYSIYFCSLFSITDHEGLLVKRYDDKDAFNNFLKKFQLRDSYNLLHILAEKNTWQGLMACENYLLRSHKILIKQQPASKTVLNSLDFMGTVGHNQDYRKTDR
jgi:hypothetical protein